jgi:hypothetical protein
VQNKAPPPHIKGVLLNVQTVKDLGTPTIIAILNRGASNAHVTTWQTNATEKKDRVMSGLSSVVEIILRITRYVRSTRNYKKNIPTSPHKSSKPYTLNQK